MRPLRPSRDQRTLQQQLKVRRSRAYIASHVRSSAAAFYRAPRSNPKPHGTPRARARPREQLITMTHPTRPRLPFQHYLVEEATADSERGRAVLRCAFPPLARSIESASPSPSSQSAYSPSPSPRGARRTRETHTSGLGSQKGDVHGAHLHASVSVSVVQSGAPISSVVANSNAAPVVSLASPGFEFLLPPSAKRGAAPLCLRPYGARSPA